MTEFPLIDLWLDDLREPEVIAPLQDPIMWVKTAEHAIAALSEGNIRWASLDHDLGITDVPDRNGQTGYTVTLWMAEHNIWPTEGIIVHSWNPVGAENMCATINRYSPYRAIRREAYGTGLVDLPNPVSLDEWNDYVQRMNDGSR